MARIKATYSKAYTAAKNKQGAAKAASIRKAEAVFAKSEAKVAEIKIQSKHSADEALDSAIARADAIKEWVNEQVKSSSWW